MIKTVLGYTLNPRMLEAARTEKKHDQDTRQLKCVYIVVRTSSGLEYELENIFDDTNHAEWFIRDYIHPYWYHSGV